MPFGPWAERGTVMMIGGAEDRFRDKVILGTFAELAGAKDGHVVVISTASSLGEAAIDAYRELFLGLGIGRVSGIRPEEREEADDPAAVQLLSEATGVFLTGGNQSRLTQVVAGTRLGDAISNAHDRGVALAGTSAGRVRPRLAHGCLRPRGSDARSIGWCIWPRGWGSSRAS